MRFDTVALLSMLNHLTAGFLKHFFVLLAGLFLEKLHKIENS